MERLEGTIPRRRLGFEATPDEVSTLCGRAWDVLVDLHAVDVAAIPALAALNRGEGYVARQVAGWTDRLARARDRRPRRLVAGHRVARRAPARRRRAVRDPQRLPVRQPRARRPTPLQVTGVLDWEMATVGDPLMDLGGALAYWVEAGDDEFFQQFRRQPSSEPGMWTRREIVEHYAVPHGPVGDARAVAVLRGLRPVPARRDRAADLVPLRPTARPTTRRTPCSARRSPTSSSAAAGSWGSDRGQILLVRHGQASWGAADYDVLSPLGERQAAAVGACWPTYRAGAVVHGAMRRQRRDGRADGRGGRLGRGVLLSTSAWDEMDHLAVLDAQPTGVRRRAGRAAVPGLVREGHPPLAVRRPRRRLRRVVAVSATGCSPGLEALGDGTTRGRHLRRVPSRSSSRTCSESPAAYRADRAGRRQRIGHQGRRRPPRPHAGVVQRARPPVRSELLDLPLTRRSRV